MFDLLSKVIGRLNEIEGAQAGFIFKESDGCVLFYGDDLFTINITKVDQRDAENKFKEIVSDVLITKKKTQ